ncbi:ATP-binding protein [Streptomyces sp. SID5468]|nr:ATP-binding protein [Streptomyces sp. SID5468]
MRLLADPRTFAAVRRTVRAQLGEWGLAELTTAAAMCVTELLSNVHKHVPSPRCVLRFTRITGGIRISVTDGDPAMPVVCEPDCLAERGRGLFLLTESVADWGARPDPVGGGKVVWFELRTDG